jgi:hypothetical protein
MNAGARFYSIRGARPSRDDLAGHKPPAALSQIGLLN